LHLRRQRPDDGREGGKVICLHHEGVTLEERDHGTEELSPFLHRVGEDRARRALRADDAAAEEPSELLEHVSVIAVLLRVEGRQKLPAVRRTAVPVDRRGEATFSVDESHDPPRFERKNGLGFLLIVRTGRIVTNHAITLRLGCHTVSYRRILGCSSI
jgi:hypothetical protein